MNACVFLAGAVSPREFPPARLPEVAFLGRSNVGKSSLLNALIGRKGMARTSSTPGRTRQVNFFRVNDACQFVDLPGYGFAKVSRAMREGWRQVAEACLARRVPGRLAVMLVDARHPPSPLDREMRDWLEATGTEYRIAATKVDKVPRGRREQNLRLLLRAFDRPGVLIPCSAETREGIPQIWAAIDRMIDEAANSHAK